MSWIQRHFFLAAFVASFTLSVSVQAQESVYPILKSVIEPTSGTIGQQFRLKVSAVAPDPAKLTVTAPFHDEKSSSWTLIGKPLVKDEKLGATEWRRTYEYTLAAFRTGETTVPAVAISYPKADGITSQTRYSPRLVANIGSVLPEGEAQLKDVKPPMPLPFPAWAYWASGTVGSLALAALLFFFWRRFSRRLANLVNPKLSPDDAALQKIESLEKEKLIEQKKIKELYTRLADCVREYLAIVYGIRAKDLTSYELLRELRDMEDVEKEEKLGSFQQAEEKLTALLDTADLVKFARVLPDPAHCRRALEQGREIVRLTRYKLQPGPEDVAQANRRGRGKSIAPPLQPQGGPS